MQSLEVFLRQRGLSFHRTETEWPEVGKREAFIIGQTFPSIFSVKQVTPVVTEIYFNSFAKLEDLASLLSAKLDTNVVVNVYQSVSTASYWALHSHGDRVRAIEAGDSEVHSHTGQRLPFEGPEPGRPSEDDADFFVFDSGEQDWYNREVGVPVEVYEDYDAGWDNFIILKAGSTKPWWRFW